MTRRRCTGTSPEAAASLPDDDDMLREILLRLPPQPSSLPRAAAVCKRWRGLVADPRFLRQFYAHHRKPPLLGVFKHSSRLGFVFTPILNPPDRIPRQRFTLGRCTGNWAYNLLDCRHGLVLVNNKSWTEVVVCDPIASEQRRVAVPPELRGGVLGGAVLCAASDQGHVHGGCHSSAFKVVLLLMSEGKRYDQPLACVYTSETGIWGNVISTEAPFDVFSKSAVLVGNCLYWLSVDDDILEFDLGEDSLTVIGGPPVTNDNLYGNCQIIQAEHGAVGYAIISYHRFQMWQRNISGHGVATWVLWKTIEMNTIIRLPSPHVEMVQLMGYDEDDVVFLCYRGTVYMVQLKSMQSRKLDEIHFDGHQYFPFKSFFIPGAAIAGGYNGAEMLQI